MAAKAKVKVVATVLETYRVVATDLPLLLRIAVVPALLLLGIGAILVAVLGQNGGGLLGAAAFELVSLIAAGLVAVPVATSWHRRILRPEQRPGLLPFPVGRPEWLYLWKSVAIFLIGLLPFIALSFITAPFLGAIARLGDHWSVLLLLLVSQALPLLIVGLIVVPFLMILPAAALGVNLPAHRSGELTLGNTWRLIAILFLVDLPFLILDRVGFPRGIVDYVERFSWQWLASEALLYLVALLGLVLTATALSLAYPTIIPSDTSPPAAETTG